MRIFFGFKIYLLTCPPILFNRFIVSITKNKIKNYSRKTLLEFLNNKRSRVCLLSLSLSINFM
jgi:hypothetical protein